MELLFGNQKKKQMKIKMKKNKTVLVLLFISCLSIGYGQNNQFELTGNINNRFNGQEIMLFAFDEDVILKVDTAIINEGKFKFHGTESLKDIGILSVGNYPDTTITLVVMLEKGNIEADMDNERVGGTFLNRLYQGYLDTTSFLNQQYRELPYNEEQPNLIVTGSPRYNKLVEMGKYMVDFKKQHIHNVVGQYLFEKEAGTSFAELFAYPATETCPDSAFT